MALNRSLPPVPVTTFAMVPRADVPRSTFVTKSGYKTTLDGGWLAPVYLEEVLPGDHFRGNAHFFVRMATPIFPVMSDIYCEQFFFFVPNRIIWTNWVKFMGEQLSPADSISYTIPQVTSTGFGFALGSIGDFFGLPVVGQQPTAALSVNSLPFRAYSSIYNEWFRDENLSLPRAFSTGDGPETEANIGSMARRLKRPDYFTSALPWPQKGGTAVPLPLGTSATVKTFATDLVTGAQSPVKFRGTTAGADVGIFQVGVNATQLSYNATAFAGTAGQLYPTNLYADLSAATGSTINALRLAVTTQQFLERDARGGTRYAELLRNHFGVTPQDARLNRPEYIGGGGFTIQTQAIPQTATYTTTPLGTLGGASVGTGACRWSYAASEHGFIIGIVNVRTDLVYMQGIHRMFTRSTRYDFYWPTFAFLGEQAIRQDEIYATGVGATDAAAFGYQERWSEYRYRPSRITGKFRSAVAGSIDPWHLAEKFATPPALNSTFIQDVTDYARVISGGIASNGMQFLLDSFWEVSATRPLPARSVPGLTRF